MPPKGQISKIGTRLLEKLRQNCVAVNGLADIYGDMRMDGILIVNKPQGMTSHDVVDFVRRRFGLKKVGHAGTLDPMATGVLIILIGKLTKSSNLLMTGDKEYEATLTLGAKSDTGDAWGKIQPFAEKNGTHPKNGIISEKEICPYFFTQSEIENVFNEFSGEIEQTPPMYSAVKHNGRKLYELARKGVTVEVKPRKINIKSLEIKKIDLPEVSFGLTCSKGTYVRQIAVDIGERLGCGAYLSKLNRTRSGEFILKDAISIEELRGVSRKELEERLIQLEEITKQ